MYIFTKGWLRTCVTGETGLQCLNNLEDSDELFQLVLATTFGLRSTRRIGIFHPHHIGLLVFYHYSFFTFLARWKNFVIVPHTVFPRSLDIGIFKRKTNNYFISRHRIGGLLFLLLMSCSYVVNFYKEYYILFDEIHSATFTNSSYTYKSKLINTCLKKISVCNFRTTTSF